MAAEVLRESLLQTRLLADTLPQELFEQAFPPKHRGSSALRHLYRSLLSEERERRRNVESAIEQYADDLTKHSANDGSQLTLSSATAFLEKAAIELETRQKESLRSAKALQREAERTLTSLSPSVLEPLNAHRLNLDSAKETAAAIAELADEVRADSEAEDENGAA